MSQNIVEYFAEHEGYRCGYCKSPDTNFSHGMWAHALTAEDYEGLLNRGWRRSGMYCYKPTNSVTCCPLYTISCKAIEFQISKSQKKVLKKFNAYLHGAKLESKSIREHSGADVPQPQSAQEKEAQEVINFRIGSATTTDTIISADSAPSPSKPESMDITDSDKHASKPYETIQQSNSSANDLKTRRSDLNRNIETSSSQYPTRVRKAKEIRLERRKQKLLKKGIDVATISTDKNVCKAKAKELEDYLEDIPNASRRFEIKLVKTSSDEFLSTFNTEFEMYKKYQMTIHGDKEDECRSKQFQRFLCDSPINNEDAETYCGTFHQYYLDDKLIAVGVVDILPTALSSVYFFYDPDYMSLSPGTFGALKEIAFVRKLHETHKQFKYYYMGFYIHSCPKMRYKGCFLPSYLQCPESFKWVFLDDKLRKTLDATKYSAFGVKPDSEEKVSKNANIKKVSILYRRSILPYEIYELRKGTEDKEAIQQYCNLVGESIAERLLLYRS